MQNRPLSHIRVLDFGHYLAGPLVGMMLADLGAEVIRIDPPGGPRWRDPAFDMLSRGKRAVTLDLKTADGRDTATDMVRRADVVIENFRPGVMERLGFGPEALRQANPDIVSLSLPGFASADPEFAGLAAWEAIIAARTGQFTDMGLNRRLMGINPSFTPLGLASAYGAAFGAMSVLFALSARGRMGGDHIEVPLASALLEGLAYNCEQIEDYPDRYKSPRELELERRTREGLPNILSFDELSEFLDPFYRTYTCADGRGFYIVSCSIVNHPQRVLEVLGLGELLKELPDFDVYVDRAEWPGEWALRSYPVGANDRKRVSDAMKAAFLTEPPGLQQPGDILPIGEDVLEYDEALQTDCRELRQKLISTNEAEVIEGFLVIQSPTALDVTSVYTTAVLPDGDIVGGHSSIDVENVTARRRAASDLFIEKVNIPCPDPEPFGDVARIGPCDLIYTSVGQNEFRFGYHFRLFEVVVTNTGPDRATGIEIDDDLLLDFVPETALGATAIWGEDPIDLPMEAEFSVSQPALERSRAEITLPDLDAGQAHTLRFWTISVWFGAADATVNLSNEAEAMVATIDTNTLNNTASVTVGLNP